MAEQAQVALLLDSIQVWNSWRAANPTIQPDLRGADLSPGSVLDANGNRAIAHEWAERRGAIKALCSANLSGADLRGADLRGLDLTFGNFVGADLREARFSKNYFARCSFRCANLADVDLSGQYLYKIGLRQADAKGANFSQSHVERADFTDADCTGATFCGAFLSFWSARGAKFHEADFSEVEFPNVEGSSNIASFHQTDGLQELLFSEGLDAVSLGADRVAEYLSLAFQFAHKIHLDSNLNDRKYVELQLSKISALRTLFRDTASPPTSLCVAAEAISAELIKYIKKNPSELYQLRPRQFEELIAEVLASYGWQVHLTSSTRDGGADIIAVSPSTGGLSNSWLIECKKYAPDNKVDVAILRSLYGLRCEQHYGGALLATTAFFTKDSLEFKSSRYDLQLRDYFGVIEWLNHYRPNPRGVLHVAENRLVLSDALKLPRV